MLPANVSRAKLFEKWKYRNINGRAALVEKYRFEKLKWFFEKLKKTNAIPWYMFSEYLTWRSFSFRYSFITRIKNFPTEYLSICSNVRLFLYLYQIVDTHLSTNGFAALNGAMLSFNLGPFYLCPPTHERLHPRKGRAIFSRHPLGVSHSCLFRAISIRPRVQRREKTSGKSGENVERGEREKKAEHLVLVISTRLGYTMRVRMRRRALGWISLPLSLFLPLPLSFSFFSSSFSSSFSSFSAVLFVFEFLRRLLLVRGGREKERVEEEKKNRAGYVYVAMYKEGYFAVYPREVTWKKNANVAKKKKLRRLVKEKEKITHWEMRIGNVVDSNRGNSKCPIIERPILRTWWISILALPSFR